MWWIASIVGVGMPVMRPSSTTLPTSAAARAAACSTSCSIEVLCAPTASAPAIRCSSGSLEHDAELLRHRLGLLHHRRDIAARGKRQISSSVACSSALTG